MWESTTIEKKHGPGGRDGTSQPTPASSSGGGGVIGAYLHWLEAGRVSTQTMRLRENQLGRLGRAHDLLTLTSDDLVAFMRRQDWKPNTAASFRTTCSSFYKWAVKHRLRDDNPMDDMRQIRVPASVPKIASAAALDQAIEKASKRDRLALMLAAYAGLRRGEIAGLHARHVDDDWITVTGKGGRTRRVPIHPELRPDLMRARDMGGYFFPDRDGDGPVTADAMGRRIARLLPDGFTAHSLRHMFATKAYQGSRDLRAVQTLLGHSSLATTQIYVHTGDDELKSAVFGV